MSDVFSGLAQDNGPVTVTLGSEPGCSSLEVTSALNSDLESDADITSQEFLGSLRELCQTARLDRLALTAFPAEPAEEGVRDDMGSTIGDDDVATV
eukprot:9061141-Pyramimonas_sp.AAC.1